MSDCRLILGDCLDVLRTLDAESVHCCVTSPPYWGLRDYGHEGQIGLEQTPEQYVARLVEVFREVRRVLRDDGTLWLNLGDSYNSGTTAPSRASKHADVGGWTTRSGDAAGARRIDWPGLKPKDLCGIPWRVAFALQADGWWLRQDIIWHKPNPMPESVQDRCTKAHEYLFLLSKRERYYYDAEAIAEPCVDPESFTGRSPRNHDKFARHDIDGKARTRAGLANRDGKTYESRNRRSVWTVATQPYSGAHFATFPPRLIEPCVLAGCPAGGTVLDPFNGAGTTGLVALENGRGYVGIELNPEYMELTRKRLDNVQRPLPFAAC